MKNIISQKEFSEHSDKLSLDSGKYVLEYNDLSHLPADDWRKVLSISVECPNSPLEDADIHFKQTVDIDPKFSIKPKKPNQKDNPKDSEEVSNENANKIEDILSQSFMRTGIISPNVNPHTASQLNDLIKSKGIILIPDTNSLCNGTLHWLLRVLRGSSVWLLPFVMSLTQMQQREASLKSLVRNPKTTNLSQALRSRTMVSAGLGLLERNRHRYQVLELDPSLLRYMRNGGKNGFDQDEGDVLEDRLLIEGVHAIFRNSRTRMTQLVVTSDVLLARVLAAEGIPNICLPVPSIDGSPIANVRYDPWARTYVGASLGAQLWDLAHTFSSVRLVKSEGATKRFSLSCYWVGKQPQNWTAEHLQLEVFDAPAQPTGSPPEGDDSAASQIQPDSASLSAVAPNADEQRGPQNTGKSKVAGASISKPINFSSASLPQASLQSTLRIAGYAYKNGPTEFEAFVAGVLKNYGGSRGNTLRALEILLRSKVIEFDGMHIVPTEALDRIDSNLRSSDLDAINVQIQNFTPYRLIHDFIRSKGTLEREDVHPFLERSLGEPVNHEAAVRLLRYLVLLGQSWIDGAVWRDGTARPNAEEFVGGFAQTFDAVARDNIARISDFLPELCRRLRISPWAAQQMAQGHARRLSSTYSFQHAVGGKPSGVDLVLAGSLMDLQEVPVPMDRIEIGGRPILTLGRVKV